MAIISGADIDRVRVLCGDPAGDSQVVDDSTITFFLEEYNGNYYRAAADAAAAIAAYYAGQVDVRVGILSSSNSQKTQQFAELATALRRRAEDRSLALAVPFAGGISVTGKEVTEENSDLVQPAFTRDLHEEGDEPDA